MAIRIMIGVSLVIGLIALAYRNYKNQR
jgi:hypothetical protein